MNKQSLRAESTDDVELALVCSTYESNRIEFGFCTKAHELMLDGWNHMNFKF